ncbi:glycosyltransferase [Thalassoroseus pseudoceratinae]|uniref:glycosyltransferase n=1 Tax=Thalassoroseus pseudoceratinae TaxID=2713176 RepID=UPI00141DBF5B|nr:glycosyltransferase [Thalassoroseus pseudoceratinae]
MIAPTHSRPTVCQVVHSLNVGGAELLAATLSRRLSDQFRFVFACLDELGPVGETLQSEGFSVEVLGRQPGVDRQCAKRLWEYCERENVQLVHAHQYTPFFQTMLARRGRRGLPILFTEHGRHHPDVRKTKRVICNRLLLKRDDRLVGVGASVRDALIEKEGLPSERVEVIYNGVDLSAFGTTDANLRSEVREELSLADSDLVVMMVARLHPLKDHLTALEAVRSLSKLRPDIKLVLVGDGEERPRIGSFIKEHSLASNVRALGTRTDVARLLSAADVFLLSSISEGIPLTIIEAMAARIPVVSTDVGGVGEMVTHGVTGLLAPPKSPEAIAEQILTVSSDASLRDTLIENARAKAYETFSLEGMLNAYRSQYEEMTDV